MKLINLSENDRVELAELGIYVVGDNKKFRSYFAGTEKRYAPDELEKAKADLIAFNAALKEGEELGELEPVEVASVEPEAIVSDLEDVIDKPKRTRKPRTTK